MPSEGISRLHALRGFLALYVVVFHAKIVLWSGGQAYVAAFPPSTWSPLEWLAFCVDMLSSAGYEMVIGFFVLSGFFIRRTLASRSTTQFYLHRVARIYPPYIASAVFAAAVLAWLATTHPQLLAGTRETNAGLRTAWLELQSFGAGDVLRTLAFLPSGSAYVGLNSVYWSLAPEVLFYAMAPFVLRRARWYYAASIALYLVGLFVPLGILAFNGYFALGAMLHDAAPRLVKRFGRVHWAMLAGLLLAVVLASLCGVRPVSEAMAAAFASAVVLALLAGRFDGWIARGLHDVGAYSFSLYLFHFPLLLLCYAGLFDLTGKLVNYGRFYLLVVPAVVLVCYGLYRLTERPALRALRAA